ncbi:class I SAM-dependent methyltransferase [Mumia flava]|nr:class I SAM-dependent methyltransferase [Mumia flava]
MRTTVGHQLDAVLGKPRTDRLRATERRVRTRLAKRLQPPPAPVRKRRRPAGRAASRPKSVPSDPFAPHLRPTMSRHELLAALHERVRPRTYFEVGVNTGGSLRLSRTRTIGVDPAFGVTHPVHCDLDLVRATSDAFFERPDAFAHFEGVPIDLAFIDGMHLSEFALRDFVNTERHLARTAVVVLDDMLPRNPLEAARDRRTAAWAGDVFKVADVLARHRPDLLVVPVNTAPTGTVVIVGVDPQNALGPSIVDAELAYCTAPDPQEVPSEVLHRSRAVDPEQLLALEVWPELVRRREAGEEKLDDLWDALRALPPMA